ncbi:MAG: leucine--tRNA ligase [Ignavibacteriae bacterium]|nr:leucine--tRNA ligase [Ignavibacteriota bacterium]MCB9214380.1 leucine--tRNA ligase [Ignavibacteria bacterium]
MAYPFSEIEPKWRRFWLENKTFATDTSRTDKPKYYVLSMYPYPSGQGLHIGHPESYTAVDILARYKRHRGFEVLNPMGWDAFGLPAEQYAMKNNVHPSVTTKANIDNFRRQLQAIGFSIDWDREVDTTDPGYYKWTQWIFLQIYNAWFDSRVAKGRHINELIAELEEKGSADLPKPDHYNGPEWEFDAEGWKNLLPIEQQNFLANFRLVYEDEIPVNWCGELGTVLANEEVDEWVEKGFTVERRPTRQWMMRITAYADRLQAGHANINWPVSTTDMQANWIGKSYGAEITFQTESGEELRIFTTRPDTIFGATFMTIAPEHPLAATLTSEEQREVVEAYRKEASLKSELDRQTGDEKTGVFTGSYAINPANGERIPIWIADYVLASYGTGAIMAVPGQDERDWEFAEKFNLPIVRTVLPPDGFDEGKPYIGDGPAINSNFLNGLNIAEAKEKMITWVEEKGIGEAKVNYKLRDWLFSRQRYWGEPIPLVRYEGGIIEPVDESELPLTLPELKEFKPSGSTESPLALTGDWLNVEHPTFGAGRRETNTMPQWAGSCWYYIRYLDPENGEQMIAPEVEERWLPVDFYIGGSEHTVTHLLYSRFWHQVLHDLGHLKSEEPFTRLLHQGMILGENSQKMSKSRGNVINPDDVIAESGADALRTFEMFMGPLEMDKPWSSNGIEGIRRFLNRAWGMIVGDERRETIVEDRPMTPDEERILHGTIRKVTEDIEGIRFNTAISALMVFVNEFLNLETKPKVAMESFAVLISPFAPHFAEEVWQRLGGEETIANATWPEYDPEKIKVDEVEIVLQVNSKIKDRITVPAGASAEELEKIALENELVKGLIEGKTVRKIVAVPDKLVNVIAG